MRSIKFDELPTRPLRPDLQRPGPAPSSTAAPSLATGAASPVASAEPAPVRDPEPRPEALATRP